MAVTDLDGFARPASFPAPAVVSLDFDGARLAFATPGCVYVARLAGLHVRAAPPAGPCARAAATLTAPRSAGPSRGNRALRYAMAPPGGSHGTLELTFRRRGGGSVRLARSPVAVPRGARRTVAVRLGPPALRALRARAGDRLGARLSLEEGPATTAVTRLTGPVRDAPPPQAPRRADDEPEFEIG